MPKNVATDAFPDAVAAGVDVAVGEDTAVSSEPVSGDVDPSVSVPATVTSGDVNSAGVDPVESPSEIPGVAGVSEHVDTSGDDIKKSDETPSMRDGVASELAASGKLVYSNGVCPLLVDEADVRSDRENVDVSGVNMTARQPFQPVVDPIECGLCGSWVSSHSLTYDPSNPGQKLCAIGASHVNHPVTSKAQDALDNGDEEKARRVAERHPKTNWLLKFLGLGPKDEAVENG